MVVTERDKIKARRILLDTARAICDAGKLARRQGNPGFFDKAMAVCKELLWVDEVVAELAGHRD